MDALILTLALGGLGLVVLGALPRETRERTFAIFTAPPFEPTANAPTPAPGASPGTSPPPPPSGAPVWGYRPDRSLDELYEEWGERAGFDPLLLKSIAIQESSERTSVRGASGEVGLMQVLCIPDADGFCQANFHVRGWEGMTAARLEDPDVNLDIATQILRWNVDHARGDMAMALAIYNGGLTPPPVSHEYAREVIERWIALRAARGLPAPELGG